MACFAYTSASRMTLIAMCIRGKPFPLSVQHSPLASTTIARRELTEPDVEIEILFCGICHSDLHSVRNEWSEFVPTVYPIVPGHEIVSTSAFLELEHRRFGELTPSSR